MSWRWMGVAAGAALVLGVAPSRAAQKDPMTDSEIGITDESGHHLRLPKDWPIERKDGRVIPASLDAYLSLKFDQVRESFDLTTRRLEALERRLGQLEEDQRALRKRLELLEGRVHEEVAHGDTAQKP